MEDKTIKDIPTENEADEVAAEFNAAGCTDIQKSQQSDGKWTVTASCPP